MTLLIPHNEQGFTACDALVFPDSLVQDVIQLLPVPASVGFCFHAPHLREFGTDNSTRIREAKREGNSPFLLDNTLIIPLLRNNEEQVDVVIYDVDAKLLKKMAPEWLEELQNKFIQQFFLSRQRYIEPGTGLYNQRALSLLITKMQQWKSLFLIATVSRRRTVAGGYQKIRQLSSLLEAVTWEPLFYFGQGVFGCVSLLHDHKAACSFSRRLISRLKREKLYRVHVGFSFLDGQDSGEQSFTACWKALVEAEKRGPFSLCDADSLQELDYHPFALPEPSVVRSLQRQWCGIDRFGLAYFSIPESAVNNCDMSSLLTGEESCFPLSSGQQIVFFPDSTRKQTAARVEKIVREAEKCCGKPPAAGYSNWPTDKGSSRIDCLRQCRKAILHGSFYGPDAVVGFDFLSVNVSGDYYFEEGDYKRAIKEYRLGLQMQPGDKNLLNSLGVALAEVNRHKEAIDSFSKVLKSWPDDHMALVNKGMSCRYIGRDRDAVHCFEKALLSPGHLEQATLELYLQLGRMYCLFEKYADAVDLFEKWQISKGKPEEFMFFKLMGEAYLGAGQHKDAIGYLQRSLQLYPGNADSLSMLGLLYVLEDEGADVGLGLCDRAIAMDEFEVEHLYRRAVALFYLERYEDSLIGARRVVQRKKNHARAVLLRGKNYDKLGCISRARQSFQRVLTIGSVREDRKKQARNYLKKLENIR